MVNDVATQAGLETAWLQAYYYKQYWKAIEYKLTTANGTKAESYNNYYDAISDTTGTSLPEFEVTGVTGRDNQNEDNLTAARNELAYK